MKADSPRWIEVTPSRWPHEKEGLDYVGDNLPDSTPYRAWSNFEFVSLAGTPYEVDLLVLCPAGLHLVEPKAMAGRIFGDDYDWWAAGSAGSCPIGDLLVRGRRPRQGRRRCGGHHHPLGDRAR